MGYQIVELDGLQIDPVTGRLPVEILSEPHQLDGPQHIGQLGDEQIPSNIMRVSDHQIDPHTMPIDGRIVHIDGSKLDTIEQGAQRNNLTDQQAQSLTSGANSSWHTHDAIYYQKTALQTAYQSQINWYNLTNVPLTFAPSDHNHDDRYFTQAQITTNYFSKTDLLGGAIDARYYTQAQIDIDFAKYYTQTQLDAGQLDNRYYTQIIIDGKFANYYTQAQLNNGALDSRYYTSVATDNIFSNYYTRAQLDTGKLDNRYYTQTAMNSILATYYTSALLDNGQLDNRYYTKTGISGLLASYYTQTQIDTTFGNYYTKTNLQTAGQAQVNWANITSLPATFTPPIASTTILGGVKIDGTSITISNGIISSTPYVLPTASSTILGGIKIGTGLTIASGVVSATAYALPTATATVLGGVKIGAGITITSGVITPTFAGTGVATTISHSDHNHAGTYEPAIINPLVDGYILSSTAAGARSWVAQYALPVATSAILGGVKQGTNTTIAADGTISVPTFPWVSITGTPTSIAGYGINLTSSNITTALGYTPINNNVIGVANGLATLDGTGRLTGSQIPLSLIGALVYQGAWNAATNVPALVSGVGTKGNYYKVSATGSTTIDGCSLWLAGDMIVYNGTTWDRIEGGITEVTSVFGRVGAVSLLYSDVVASLGFTPYDAANPSHYLTTGTLPIATTGSAGIVSVGSGINVSGGVISVTPYSLPIATDSILGGVKQGANITIGADGTISAGNSYVLPTASNTVLGGVKIDGTSIVISNGVISASYSYTLPIATATVLGGVKQGANISIAADGTISGSTPYVLPTASTSVIGGIKVDGSSITISNGAISATPYVLPIASSITLGGVKQGVNVTIDGTGVLSVPLFPWSSLTGTPTSIAGYGINLTSSNITTALGYTPVNNNLIGSNNGLATLDGSGHLTSSQIPLSLVGALVYQGVWNAATNTPNLVSGVGTKGWYYKVSTPGSTIVDGCSLWISGDMIVFDGNTWDRIEGGVSEVTSVFGRVGAVTLLSTDIIASLGFTPYSASNPAGYITASTLSGAIPLATTSVAGIIKIGAGLQAYQDGTALLVPATTSLIGGIKVGAGIQTAMDGTASLVPASSSLIGGIKVGAGIQTAMDGTASLVPATSSLIGGIKVGAGIQTALDGTASLVPSTTSVIGGIKVGAGIQTALDGTASLVPASNVLIGGIKVGAGIQTALDGTASLVPATSSVIGGIKVGSGLTAALDGTLSATYSYALPVATSSVLGGVKQGSNVIIASDGTISTVAYNLLIATSSVLGGVKQGTNIAIDSGGIISVPNFPWASITGTPTSIAGYGINLTAANITAALSYIPINSSIIGANNGLATLDASGHLTSSQIPLSLVGALVYQGVWNAATNTPALVSGTGTKGWYYKVSTSGSTVIDGNSLWTAGDMIVFDGNTWDRIEGGGSEVVSVFGRIGNVSLLATDITTSLGFTPYNATNPAGYLTTATLPVASASVSGVVKIGSGITVSSGTISVTPYTLPVATATVVGGVKQGANVTIAADGTISVSGTPIATATVVGGVKQGANTTIAADGTISVAAPYVLPAATSSIMGGVIVGSGLGVSSGTISVAFAGTGTATTVSHSDHTHSTYESSLGNPATSGYVLASTSAGVRSWIAPYSLPIASSTVLGGIEIGSGLSINGSGVVSVVYAGNGSANSASHSDHIHANDVTIGGPFYTAAQLDGGQLDTRYYTITQENNNLALKSNVGHIHDDRYYTQTQIMGLLAGYSVVGHVHDDRYFTQTQSDARYYTQAQLNAGQLNNLYYTETQINSMLSGYSVIGHIHDDRYYTKSQNDASFAGKAALVHTHDDRYFTQSQIIASYYSKTDLTTGALDTRYYTSTIVDQKFAAFESFGIMGAVDHYSNLTSVPNGQIWIVRYTDASGVEGFYKHDNGVWTFLAPNTGATDHNSLNGLNVADYQHLTAAQLSGLTSGVPTVLHSHDNQYYTQSQINAGWYTQLQLNSGQLDARYYTKSIIDSDFANYYSKTDLNNGAMDSRYYTEAQINTLLAGYAPVVHTHDSRYYQQSQVDAFLAGKAALVHTHDDRYFTQQYITSTYYDKPTIDAKFAGISSSTIQGAADTYWDLPASSPDDGDIYIVRFRNSNVKNPVGYAYQPDANTLIMMNFDGNTNDAMNHANQVTPGNAPLTYTTGKIGTAVNMTEGFVTFPNHTDFNAMSTGFTCAMWIKPNDPSQYVDLFDKYDPGTGGVGWLLALNGQKLEVWAQTPTMPEKILDTFSIIPMNVWTHVAVTYDGTTFRIYKNGMYVNQMVVPGPIPPNTVNVDIGRYFNDYYTGLMDQFILSKHVFSQNEMEMLVNNNQVFTGFYEEGFYRWNKSSSTWTWLMYNQSGIYHNDLWGINTEDYMHLDRYQFADLTTGTDASARHNHGSLYFTKSQITTTLAGYSITTHLHDDRYYTQAQINTFLAGYSVLGHTHDDRYYTQAQITAYLAGKSDTTHNHDSVYYTQIVTNATFYNKTQLDGGQLDNRYYTQTAANALLAGKAPLVHTHDDRYFTQTQINTSLAGYSPVGHIHDDRYFTQIQVNGYLALKSDTTHNHDATYVKISSLAANSGTTGASMVGLGTIAGMTSATVQAAIAELKTSIAAIPLNLQQAYNGGAAIVSTAAVKIDSTASTAAPLELTNRTTTPTTGLSAGQMAIINNELFIYRLDKSKWLTPSKFITFGKDGFADGCTLSSVGVRNENAGILMQKAGTIVSCTMSTTSVVANKEVNIRLNGTSALSLLTTSTGIINQQINQDFNAGDLLSVKVSATGNALTDPVMTLEICWRA